MKEKGIIVTSGCVFYGPIHIKLIHSSLYYAWLLRAFELRLARATLAPTEAEARQLRLREAQAFSAAPKHHMDVQHSVMWCCVKEPVQLHHLQKFSFDLYKVVKF